MTRQRARATWLSDQYEAAREETRNAFLAAVPYFEEIGYVFKSETTYPTTSAWAAAQRMSLWILGGRRTCTHASLAAPSLWTLPWGNPPVVCCTDCARPRAEAWLRRGDERFRCDCCNRITHAGLRDGLTQAANFFIPIGICESCFARDAALDAALNAHNRAQTPRNEDAA